MLYRMFIFISIFAALTTPSLSTSAYAAKDFAKVLSTQATASPTGYGPGQLRAAYQVPAGGSAYVAVVDAYNDATIKADLDAYSRTFGLPILPVCTSAAQRGCFGRLNQRGADTFGAKSSGWALETALDVEAVHAMCSGCRIEVVEADTASTANLMVAVDQAVVAGAQVVSMSWGGSESSAETTLDAHFRHPGVIFVASSGDSGYGVSYPAASGSVIAVGGTHLVATSGGRVSETAWAGSGSGCSSYESKPAWQHDAACSHRSVADLAADADPATGAAVYSSTSPSGGGWFVVGGTSLAAPLVAGMVGLAGGGSQATIMSRLYTSLSTGRLFDITSGRNGNCSTYLCQAVRGYDGPTGLGSLTGLGAL